MTDITLTEARAKAEAARKLIEAAQIEMAESIKQVLSEGTAVFFEKYPFLGSIAWAQYTPYFNDGDPCVFSSAFTYPSINSVTDIENEEQQIGGDESGPDFYRKANKTLYDYDYEERRSREIPNPDYDPEYEACEKEIRAFMDSLAGDEKREWGSDQPSTFDAALLRAFGDHAFVTISRDGIEVGDYYHE